MKMRRTTTFKSKLYGMVAPLQGFPTHRSATCCGQKIRKGEPIVVLQLESNLLLHRRCLVQALNGLPLDPKDYQAQFDKIRRDILASQRRKGSHDRDGRANP